MKFKITKLSIKIKNYYLCKRYPFLEPRNVWTDKVADHHYEWTEYDQIPDGWRKAFGRKLIHELRKELKKTNYLYKFRFSQIKEKYGTLRLYCMGAPHTVHDILWKYEKLSAQYCMICGKPGRLYQMGWWTSCCPKHAGQEYGKERVQKYLQEELKEDLKNCLDEEEKNK